VGKGLLQRGVERGRIAGNMERRGGGTNCEEGGRKESRGVQRGNYNDKGLTMMFINLKAAFDSVDRRVLIEALEERGVRKDLVERVKEMLRETKSRVRIGEETGGNFWTGRGLRQGCPLSPLLFNILTADMEEELERVKWGGLI